MDDNSVLSVCVLLLWSLYMHVVVAVKSGRWQTETGIPGLLFSNVLVFIRVSTTSI